MSKFTMTKGPVKGAHMLPNVSAMPYFDQGTLKACGTTSLAMAMTYLGAARTKEQIDAEIRRMDIFTSPVQLIRYARRNGLAAEGYNNGAIEFIIGHIDQGHPCICIINADYTYPAPYNSSISGLHYVVVVGYGKHPASGEDCLIFHDPNIGEEPENNLHGADMVALVSDFVGVWNSVGWGFHDYFFALGKDGAKLPPGNDHGVEGPISALDGVTHITNGIDRFIHPQSFVDWLQAIPEFVGGVVQTVIGGVGGLIETLGNVINDAVDGIPVVSNVVKPIGDILIGIGAALGDIATGIGNIIDDLGNILEDIASGDIGAVIEDAGQVVVDAVEAVADAVVDVVNAVADAVSDFFSGW